MGCGNETAATVCVGCAVFETATMAPRDVELFFVTPVAL